MHSNFNQQSDKVMTPDQFTQVVEAILEGKYSWACVLILRFAGYNPLHYIPYRTYNRLMKDNAQPSRIRIGGCAEHSLQPASESVYLRAGIQDLGYLRPLGPQSNVSGGSALFINFRGSEDLEKSLEPMLALRYEHSSKTCQTGSAKAENSPIFAVAHMRETYEYY